MRRAALFFLLLAVSCGGGTCGGCVDASYTFPQDDPARPDAIIQEDVVRTRITQAFLDFVRPQLPALLLAQAGDLGGGITIEPNGTIRVPLPDQQLFNIGVADAELRDAEAVIFLDDLEQRLRFDLTEPSGVRLVLENLRVGLDLKLKQNVIGSTSSCPVTGDLGSDPKHAAEVTVRATIDPGVGPRPDYALDFDINVGNIELDDIGIDVLGRSAYCAERECQDCTVEVFGTCLDPGGRCVECDIFCGAIGSAVAALLNALSGVIAPLLDDLFAPLIDGFIDDAVGQLNGTPAKVETAVDLASLAGLDILRRSQPLGLFAAPRPGRFPVNDRGAGLGMEVTLDSGLESDLADCVAPIAPFTPNKGPVPTLSGLDSQNRPYHLGFTFASSFLNQALYTAHRAGTLCLKLTTDDIRGLTGGAFAINASLLSLVASDLTKLADPAAPVIIELKPRNPATLELGSGERTGVDDMGNDVFDWLFKVRWTDVGVAFHVLIQDRYVRAFEVTTDIFVGLNLTVQPNNSLEVAVGELRIDDFREEFNELLPNADFGEILPTLLDVALGTLLNQALVFDFDLTTAVSDALGGAPILLRVNDIFRDGVQEDYLTMSLTFSATTSMAFARSVHTQARLHSSEPGVLQRRPEDEWRPRPTGAVRLVVGESLPNSTKRELEYQVRVDNGLWSIWRSARADDTLVAPDVRLKMPGWHTVEVRARRIDDYATLDATPAALRVLVDPLPPRLSARHGTSGIDVTVRDTESAGAADPLRLEMRSSQASDWQPVSLTETTMGQAEATIDYGVLTGVERLELRARDGSGNPSEIISLNIPSAGELDIAATSAAPETGLCRCIRTEGVPVGGLSLFWLGLFGALMLRRRTTR